MTEGSEPPTGSVVVVVAAVVEVEGNVPLVLEELLVEVDGRVLVVVLVLVAGGRVLVVLVGVVVVVVDVATPLFVRIVIRPISATASPETAAASTAESTARTRISLSGWP